MIHVAVLALLSAATFSISIEPCGFSVTAQEVERIATLELAQLSTGVALAARVECRGRLWEVSVDDPVTRKTLARRVDLSSVPPPARARTLALALVELVEASWSELLLPQAHVIPAGEAPTAAQQEAATSVVREPTKPFRVEVLGAGRRFPSMALWLWGSGARVSFRPGWLGVGADVRAEHGVARATLGNLSVDSIGGSLFAVAGHAWAWLTLEGGLGARAGSARVTGTPMDPALATGGSQAGAWLGPMGFGQAGVRWERLLATVGVEGGLVVLGVRGRVDGTGGVGVSGPYFQLSLSMGLKL